MKDVFFTYFDELTKTDEGIGNNNDDDDNADSSRLRFLAKLMTPLLLS
jgi:hypothetical protein